MKRGAKTPEYAEALYMWARETDMTLLETWRRLAGVAGTLGHRKEGWRSERHSSQSKIYAEISIKLHIYITKIVFKILQVGLFKDTVRKF